MQIQQSGTSRESGEICAVPNNLEVRVLDMAVVLKYSIRCAIMPLDNLSSARYKEIFNFLECC